jgi:hypothetical protein
VRRDGPNIIVLARWEWWQTAEPMAMLKAGCAAFPLADPPEPQNRGDQSRMFQHSFPSRSASLIAGLACVVIGLFGIRSSQAQSPEAPNLNDKGFVEHATGEFIKVKLTKDTWIVAVQPSTKVTVIGTAEPDYLHSGLFVKFSGELDKKGTVLQKEVEQLEIFSPPAGKKGGMGVFEAGATDDAKPVAKPVDGTSYEFRTKVVAYKPGEMTVTVGGKKVVAKTSPTLIINVNSDDLSLAQEGDAVSISGWYAPQQKPNPQTQQPGTAAGQQISVTMSKPLAATKKHKAAAPVKTVRAPKGAPPTPDAPADAQNPFSK